jgi:alanyl aminopeptidase
MSVASSIWYGYKRGTLSADKAYAALEPLASDPHPLVATQPMSLLWQARDWFHGTKSQASVAAHGSKLYGPVWRRLGTKPKPNESPEIGLLRRDTLTYLALGAEDPAVRKQAKQLARAYLGLGKDGKLHPDAVASDLAPIVVRVLGQDADASVFEALLSQLAQTQEEDVRGTLLGGLTVVRDPELAKRARELLFDDRLKVNESNAPLFNQLGGLETRDATWAWLSTNIDRIIERLSPRRAGWLPSAASVFCTEEAAAQAQALFGPRGAKLAGGERSLANATETIRLCAARKKAQLDSLRKALGE